MALEYLPRSTLKITQMKVRWLTMKMKVFDSNLLVYRMVNDSEDGLLGGSSQLVRVLATVLINLF